MADDVEERSVSKDQVRGGVQLKAGHPVVLIVDGVQGTPRKGADAAGPDADAPTTRPTATKSSPEAKTSNPAAATSTRAATTSPAAPAAPSRQWATTGAAAMTVPAAGPPPTKPPYADDPVQLQDCKFQDGTELQADTAWLTSKIGGLDGQQVQFVLETEEDGKFREVASGVSTVKAGEARTGIAIPSQSDPSQSES